MRGPALFMDSASKRKLPSSSLRSIRQCFVESFHVRCTALVLASGARLLRRGQWSWPVLVQATERGEGDVLALQQASSDER